MSVCRFELSDYIHDKLRKHCNDIGVSVSELLRRYVIDVVAEEDFPAEEKYLEVKE